jgi:hypothetical protein
MPDDYLGPFIKGPNGQELKGGNVTVCHVVCYGGVAVQCTIMQLLLN